MTQLPAGTMESKASSNSSRLSPRILRFENHDEALRIWRESAGTGRILVHVDAHHDMWWVGPSGPVTIANFISPAVQEGILREIYWVVPGPSWESPENRRQIFHHLRRMQRTGARSPARIETGRDRMSTRLLGIPLHVCSVESLPGFAEDVLLDLDVDYLIFLRVTYGAGDPHPELPGRWPADLVQALQARGVTTDLVTIASSVEGGYTPLRWKYLGEELEIRLQDHASGEVLHGMDSMREASMAAAGGDRAAAEQKYLYAAGILAGHAAPLWHLAMLYLDSGRAEQAQSLYQRAFDIDPSYRTPYNNEGIWDYWAQRWAASERAYRRMLEMDSRDAYAHLGLAWLAMEQSRWSEAETELHQALEIDSDLLDAHRALGRVFLEAGKIQPAIAAYEKSLKLSLSGKISLRDSPLISAEQPQWNDPSHFAVYLRLGQLYRAAGEALRASQCLRMAAAGGLDSVAVRVALARLALAQGQRLTATAQAGRACGQSVVWMARNARKFLRGLGRPFLRACELWRVR